MRLGMALIEISDEILGTFVPIAVYWLYSGMYMLLDGWDEYRLHPKGEEYVKNVGKKIEVVFLSCNSYDEPN